MAADELLERVLYWEAAVLWVAAPAVLVIAPGGVFVDLLDQPPAPDADGCGRRRCRRSVLAMLMVLVAQKLEELWWWSWAFAVVFDRHRHRLRC